MHNGGRLTADGHYRNLVAGARYAISSRGRWTSDPGWRKPPETPYMRDQEPARVLRPVGYDPIMASTVLNWNGEELPEELRTLPKGRYVLVPVDEVPKLSADREAGLEAALASIRDGRGVSRDEARRRAGAVLKR